MAHPYMRELTAAIWPEGLSPRTEIWAILDGARDERITPMVQASYAEWQCLYAGDLPPKVQAVSPYLVKLEPGESLAKRILSQGWGESWGVILRTETGAQNLRRHLRQFLRVQDETGRKLLFRYYDPRVLRVYLPTCTPDELRTFFGPVQSFLTDTENPASLIEFRWDGVRLFSDTHSFEQFRAGA
jgi:hypothetical protein